MVKVSVRHCAIGIAMALVVPQVLILTLPSALVAHPLHTSLAEVTHEPAARAVRVSLRVFIDDFTAASLAHARWIAARQPAGTPQPTQSPYVTYALAAFRITDAAGRAVPLTSCGGRRNGELMWLCFRGSLPRGMSGLRVKSHVLFDLYRDQINIVQASYGGRKTTLLFTRGDAAKKLP